MLCTGDPATLTGRVAYARPLLEERGLTRPAPGARRDAVTDAARRAGASLARPHAAGARRRRRRGRRRVADRRARPPRPRPRGPMVREALDDAGLTLADVDGICYAGGASGSPSSSASTPASPTPRSPAGRASRSTSSTPPPPSPPGSATSSSSCTRDAPRSDRARRGDGPRRRPARCGAERPMAEWEVPYGLAGPVGGYALAASRHMAQYGTTSEQLAADRGQHAASGRR